jgi:molybdopterin-synthase adenylyltransferase
VGLHELYRQSLTLGISPHRYLRNREAVSLEDQLRLASSQVTVIGAGGLGGHVIHLLSRIGVGCLVVVDCDRFDETNLNRQIFCTMDSLGKPKAHIASEREGRSTQGWRCAPTGPGWTMRICRNS